MFFRFHRIKQILLPILFLSVATSTLCAQNSYHLQLLPQNDTILSRPKISWKYISNQNSKTTRIGFSLMPGDTTIAVKSVEWVKDDTIYQPLTPFSATFENKSKQGKNIFWNIIIDFPYTEFFGADDFLAVETNRGTLKTPTSKIGLLLEETAEQKEQISFLKNHIDTLTEKESKTGNWLFVFILLSGILLITALLVFYFMHRRLVSADRRMKELTHLNNVEKNSCSQMHKTLEELFRSRFSTMSKLCDEYYEKNGSETVKLTVYNEIEKYINTYKDKKNIVELQETLNLFYDNIINKLIEQLPELSESDINFLTYIYSGFSPRAVCIFTDINMKHYYYRRNKIKGMITDSDAPDKDFFLYKLP